MHWPLSVMGPVAQAMITAGIFMSLTGKAELQLMILTLHGRTSQLETDLLGVASDTAYTCVL